MKTFILLTVLSLLAGNSLEKQSTLHISTGKSAYAYHAKQSCKTHKRCNEEGHVKTITLEEAESMGRLD